MSQSRKVSSSQTSFERCEQTLKAVKIELKGFKEAHGAVGYYKELSVKSSRELASLKIEFHDQRDVMHLSWCISLVLALVAFFLFVIQGQLFGKRYARKNLKRERTITSGLGKYAYRGLGLPKGKFPLNLSVIH